MAARGHPQLPGRTDLTLLNPPASSGSVADPPCGHAAALTREANHCALRSGRDRGQRSSFEVRELSASPVADETRRSTSSVGSCTARVAPGPACLQILTIRPLPHAFASPRGELAHAQDIRRHPSCLPRLVFPRHDAEQRGRRSRAEIDPCPPSASCSAARPTTHAPVPRALFPPRLLPPPRPLHRSGMRGKRDGASVPSCRTSCRTARDTRPRPLSRPRRHAGPWSK